MANNIVKIDGISRLGTTVYASAARTATPDTQEFEIGPSRNALTLVIDTTAVTSTPSTVFKVEGVDRVSGKVYALLTSAAVVGTGTVTMFAGQSLTAVSTTTANAPVPPVVRVTATHGNANSHTYTVGLILS